MVRKVAKLGAVKTVRNWSRSERNVGVSCMCGLLVARDPGCCATSRIHPWPEEDAIPHAYSPIAKSVKPELSDILCPVTTGWPTCDPGAGLGITAPADGR